MEPLSIVAAGLAGGAGVAAYGAFIEPRRIQLTHHEVPLIGWPRELDGLRVLHLTDLHTRGEGPVERFLKRLPALLDTPDLLLLTGDLVEHPEALDICLRTLAPIQARYGGYVVYGNNDLEPPEHMEALTAGLDRLGLTLLDERCERVDCRGLPVWIGGFPYVHVKWGQTVTYPVAKLFAPAPAGEPRILLSHAPDAVVEASENRVQLMLSGHTHGGQICLPGGVAVHRRFDRPALSEYVKGLHRYGDTSLFVSRGLGLSTPTFRMFCRPEVTVLTLRSAAA